MRSVPFAPLEPALYRETVRRALAEDLGWGDVTTEATVGPTLRARGLILAKCDCVIAGLDIAAEAFSQLDPAVVFTKHVEDGQRCTSGTTVATVRGSAAAMLTAERTALNFLQKLSGIASVTRRYVDAAGGSITVLDTRKTAPTLRALENMLFVPAARPTTARVWMMGFSSRTTIFGLAEAWLKLSAR